ncbi:uncharacterized protein GLRG_05069 [Colletotrichum graminicola M1.001]|uniref:Uncharacterized protein n=1 Tax=Colletotrichum graminicola (strain M1.001 / M2 / FGSC 10212) TaxID=645133 RepID=E3QGD7_COLGM|nr:uncharacterized protein GLRG_05069 [Colletotrichum graminicola M1.001]EFQ29925.1 hypothetical protein GLRG_05069 [Colletotrichum graminicola M1.001]
MEIMAAVQDFVRRSGGELFDINFLVLMCFMYRSYQQDPQHQSFLEEAAWSSNKRIRSNGLVPKVNLAEFLAYMPHIIRKSEHLGLATYGHPFRAVSSALAQDTNVFGDQHSVQSTRINEAAVMTAIDDMGLTLADFRESTRHILVLQQWVEGPCYEGLVMDRDITQFSAGCLTPYRSDKTKRYGGRAEQPLLVTAPELVIRNPRPGFAVAAAAEQGPQFATDNNAGLVIRPS